MGGPWQRTDQLETAEPLMKREPDLDTTDSMDAQEAAFWRNQWDLAPGVVYLNHGSFGPPPKPVQDARRAWQEQQDRQPMDFFMRRYEEAWFGARRRLAEFVGAEEGNLVFADNATAAMNVVASSVGLAPGDEVVLTDHEYGAVTRIWRRATERVGGVELRIAELPLPVESPEAVVESILAATSDRTRLLIVSHITSPTAITLPVGPIVQQARRRGIAVCVDGPHAVAQLPLALDGLGCDFYCASCHKWLSAPFGSGFLYVAPRFQEMIQPPLLSWGRLAPSRVAVWSDEFIWSGTRDPSACLSIPSAIDFLRQVGLDRFRRDTHRLAQYARQRLVELVGQPPIVPDSSQWYGCMAHVPLPPGETLPLQQRLWSDFGIEVPIVGWNDRRWIRVSCHLYNTAAEIDRLVDALRRLL
jgi:isopenicillin-N epimerase